MWVGVKRAVMDVGMLEWHEGWRRVMAAGDRRGRKLREGMAEGYTVKHTVNVIEREHAKHALFQRLESEDLYIDNHSRVHRLDAFDNPIVSLKAKKTA